MDSLMMDYQLTLTGILRRAKEVYPERELVTRLEDGSLHRYTYGEFYQRVLKLMQVLRAQGVKPGDRVATFAWNHARHLELYFAVPCLGAVLHTLNIRLFPDQLSYIAEHAEDQIIFADSNLLSQLEEVQDELKTVRQFVVMDDSGTLPETTLSPVAEYESLLAAQEAVEAFPDLNEQAPAAMCYTSGTTGNPKGVVYSHRALYLHSMCACMNDVLAIKEADVILPMTSMFHANCWGIPYAAVMTGAKMVFPGPNPHSAELVDLIEREKVTFCSGVPTIWNMLYQYLQTNPRNVSSLSNIVCGGSAVPKSLMQKFDETYGVTITQLWGMTELTPLGTVSQLKNDMMEWGADEQYAMRGKQGVPVPGVEVRILDNDGKPQPWDGESIGELCVRGPWVASAYYNNPASAASFTEDGWFRTGDVATMDTRSFMQIADRTKDLIKSGGEWISSVEMENALMAHPDILEAAVVARPDDQWDERPMAYVVPVEGAGDRLTDEVLYDFLLEHFAKWQVPYKGDYRVIDAVPKTSVGKFDKKVLRQQYLESRAS
ncbi:MAG: long-chain fatty acid--CoA ligase [Gammaproteobacteria bacterium]|nr:long-chain fatty acid--CoA ligase [Gammaproteobacteria bacterium]